MARKLLSVWRNWLWPAGSIVCTAFFWRSAAAQYREPSEYNPTEVRFISAGLLQSEFRPLASNTLDDSLAIRYDQLMPVVGFRQGGVEILAGYTRYDLRGTSCESVILSATVLQDLLVAGGLKEALLLPVMFSSDFVKAETQGPTRETFSVTSLGIGAGLKFRSFGRSHDAWVSLLGVAHYSFEGLGTGSGFSPALIGEATVLLPDAVWSVSLAMGYRFRLQSWSMSEERFNYRSVSHGPYIGVVF